MSTEYHPTDGRIDAIPASHRLVFVGGLHRSGTTPLARALAAHQLVSGFSRTGVMEDEGQHLQTVYPAAEVWGGSGHFARDTRTHLRETSALATPGNARRLLEAWAPHWDLSRPVLVEKSPPNLVMGRFLQALFPEARFVMIVRHPVTVALSTRKWTHLLSRNPSKFANLSMLVHHWLIAHRALREDLPFLRHVHVMRYEALVQRPQESLEAVTHFLDLPSAPLGAEVESSRGLGYQHVWDSLAHSLRPGGWQRRYIEKHYAREIASYGYQMDDLSTWSESASI